LSKRARNTRKKTRDEERKVKLGPGNKCSDIVQANSFGEDLVSNLSDPRWFSETKQHRRNRRKSKGSAKRKVSPVFCLGVLTLECLAVV